MDWRSVARDIGHAVRGTRGTTATDEDLLTWQDRLCGLRRLSPPVLNLVDKRVRDRSEQAMNASATALWPVARNQPGVN